MLLTGIRLCVDISTLLKIVIGLAATLEVSPLALVPPLGLCRHYKSLDIVPVSFKCKKVRVAFRISNTLHKNRFFGAASG